MRIAYKWQVRIAVTRAARALRTARTRYRNAERDRLRRIRRLEAPERLTEPAYRYTAALMEADAIRDGRTRGTAQRAMELSDARLRATEARKALFEAPGTPEEHSYCDALKGLAADNERDWNACVRETSRALSELIARLESIRAPERKRWRHEALCSAWRDEFVALSTYYARMTGTDPAAVRDAFAGYADAVEVRSGRLRALGFYELKPSR
jgi:hypothetical protein